MREYGVPQYALSLDGLTGGLGTSGAKTALLAVRLMGSFAKPDPGLDKDLRAAAPALNVALLGAK
jgi:hypothetical protein